MSNFHESIAGRFVIAGNHASSGGTNNYIFECQSTHETPTRPREPFSTVPFAPDPDFVDRPEILAWVRNKCVGPGARAALVGLGGIGKSQLAIQYAHSVRDATPRTFVFWVHASTPARFEEAYRDIADRLKLPGRQNPKEDVLRLVCNWLRDETNGRWTMVLDNVDDVNTFFPPREHQRDEPDEILPASLLTYLPQSCNGSILITSRNKDAAARLTGSYNNVKEVLAMEESQGLQLLRNKLQVTSNKEGAAVDLLYALDCMPLAINQAAAYINRRAHMTITGYLNEFRANSRKRKSLLNWDAGDLRRDDSASNSVVTTWQMSFERIRHERPSAADLLSLMSFFNPQGIPKWILQRHSRSAGETVDEAEAGSAFDEDLDLLRAYSLVAATAETDMCEMHALVQFCTRVWLSTFSKPKQWDRVFLELMANEFPWPNFEDWAKCQQLLPHVDSLYEAELFDAELVNKWVLILNYVARYVQAALGKYGEAEKLNRRALEGSEKKLGVYHLSTLVSVGNLAVVLKDQGKYGEAEELNRRALEWREKELGVHHLDTLTIVSNLALVLGYQGKYEEAEKLNRRALEGKEKELGVHHPSTLTSVSNLALVLGYQGKYDEAEKLNQRALEGKEKELGVHHPDTLTSVYCLAYLLHMMKRYAEAAKLYQRAYNGRVQKLGPQHPKTIACSNHFLALQQEAKVKTIQGSFFTRIKGKMHRTGL